MAEVREKESAVATDLLEEREAAFGAGDHLASGKDGTGQAPVSDNKRGCAAAGVREDEDAMVSTEEEIGWDECAAEEEAADAVLECTPAENTAVHDFSGETCSSSVNLTHDRIEDNVNFNEEGALLAPIPVTLVDKVEEIKYTQTSCMNTDESNNAVQNSPRTFHSDRSAKDQPTANTQLNECFLAVSPSAPPCVLKEEAEIKVPVFSSLALETTMTIPQTLNNPQNRKGLYKLPAVAIPQNCVDLDRPEASANPKERPSEENLETLSLIPSIPDKGLQTPSDHLTLSNPVVLKQPVVEPDISDGLAEDCAQEYPGSPMDLDDEGSQDACENPLMVGNLQARTSSAHLTVTRQSSQSGNDDPGNPEPKVTVGVCNGDLGETHVSANQTYLSHGTVTHLGSSAEDSSLPYSLEFEKHWKATQDDPSNFSAWTNLLDYVGQENYILAARKAYTAFFTRYLYCYGYWKKYADMERRFGNLKEAEEVFEQSLQAIPLSVDLWMHYITFLQETLDMIQPESVQRIRNVFEMALAAAGMYFHSDKLWETYINWEKAQGDLQAVTVLYDRVLATPTQLYNQHFEKFKEHVTSNSPVDIVSKEEFVWVRSKLMSEADSTVNRGNGDELQVHEASEEATQVAEVEKKSAVDMEKMKEVIISLREQVYKQNEVEVSKRWTFEESIKRSYFHMKPLERAQLMNWNNYLDFEIANGSHSRTIVLFERCVIACAQYEEFWLKYTKYLENHTVIGTRSVFQRSCLYHLPKKPNLHLLWAAFEERQGDTEQARNIMKTLDEAVPGLVMVRLRRVSLERRAGNMEAAEALLRESILESEGTSLAAFYSSKLARQVLKLQKNLSKAREILQEALSKDPDNTKLYLNLLEVEFSADPKHNEGNTINCIERVLRSNLPSDAKIVFSQRRVEFLEDFGSSVRSLLTAYDNHQKLLKLYAPKRKVAENGTTDEHEEKKAKVEEITSAPAVTAASSPPLIVEDTSTNQVAPSAAYNYNNWYQSYGAYSYQNTWNYNYFPQS